MKKYTITGEMSSEFVSVQIRANTKEEAIEFFLEELGKNNRPIKYEYPLSVDKKSLSVVEDKPNTIMNDPYL